MDLQSLFRSVEAGDIANATQLLDKQPGLIHVRNATTEKWDEQTVLHCASKHGRLDIVRLLVERGAEVYSNPMASYPPVIIAAWNGHQALVDYFLKDIPDKANGTNKLGVTINLAARQGWIDIVRKHVEVDPLAVHQRGWIGDTPLHWPAHNGFVDIVTLLLDAGADIEADEISCYGGKPLHWASEHEPETVKLLLERGANVNARNVKPDSEFYGVTPLIMNATQKNDCSEVTKILLAAGADISATDAQGKTALAHAMDRGLERIVSVLSAHRAA
jgi:ankyrin repeat protein